MEKNIIVTGASGNLGKAVTETFIKNGYGVFGIEHKSHPLIKKGGNHWLAGIDLADSDAANNIVNEIIELQPVINVLVCTAGGFAPGKMESTKSSQISDQVQLNFITAFNMVQPVIEQMKKQGHGQIFLVGSKPGLDITQGSNSVAYALSKSLIFRLAELLNHNYSSEGIQTWVIVPGTIDTPQNRAAMPNHDFSEWVLPSTIAETILDYCQENAKEGMLISF